MSNSTHLLVPACLEVCNGPSAVYVTNVGLQNLCHLCKLNFPILKILISNYLKRNVLHAKTTIKNV